MRLLRLIREIQLEIEIPTTVVRFAAVGLPDSPFAVSPLHLALRGVLPSIFLMPSMDSSLYPYPLIALAAEAMSTEDTTRRQSILRELFAGYTTVCEAPACFFVDDIIEMYPGVKLILNTLPPNTKPKLKRGMFKHTIGFPIKLLSHGLSKCFSTGAYIPARDYLIRRRYNVRSLYSPQLFERHNEWVRNLAREKGVELLEWNENMGWEPLCKFLGAEVPVVPFPKVRRRLRDMYKVAFA
jgi:hypothetical protein